MQQKLERIALLVVSLTALFGLLFKIGHPGIEYTDSMSLFNPVYMYANYGKLVYPIHGYFDSMPVHPPIYYRIQGYLYVFFQNKELAYTAPVILLFIYYSWQVLNSKREFLVRLAWFLPVYAQVLFEQFQTRPELFISLAFFTGIWHLESLLWNFKLKHLILGATFLSLASISHYFSSFAFVGLGIYFLAVYHRRNENGLSVRNLTLAIILPLFIVGGYFVFHVLPNFYDILRQISGVSKMGNPLYSIQAHFDYYKHYKLLGIPPLILASVLFIFNYRARRVYLASLPVVLFVFFFSSGKSEGYYFIESTTFYLIAALTIVYLFENIQIFRILLIGLFTICTILITVSAYQDMSSANVNINAEDIRKSSQYMFGKNNTVGSRMDLWYISGTEHYYNMLSDLTYSNDAWSSDPEYFDHFDFFAEHAHMSDARLKEGTTFGELYFHNKLRLKGYLFSGWQFQPLTDVSNMVFLSHGESEFMALVLKDRSKFIEAKQTALVSDDYFVSVVAELGEVGKVESTLQDATLFNLYNDAKTRAYPGKKHAKMCLVFGFTRGLESLLKFTQSESACYLDIIPLSIEVKPYELLDTISTTQIKFYRNIDSLKYKSAYY